MTCKIKLACIIAIIGFLFGCEKDGYQTSIRLRSYVNYYVDSEFKLYSSTISPQLYLWHNDSLAKGYSSPEVAPKHKTNAEFLRIAERNGDRSYNKKEVFSSYCLRRAWTHNFKSVRVVCLNRAWDPSHPVGASLNDITEIECSSYVKYVHSGYDDAFESSGRIKKPLLQLTEDELTIIDPYIGFTLKEPDEPGTYRMQVTMVTTEGEERVAECDFIWE